MKITPRLWGSIAAAVAMGIGLAVACVHAMHPAAHVVLITAIALAFLFAGWKLHGLQFKRRVYGLVAASVKVAEGDLQTRFHDHGTDDLAQLSRVFDSMVQQLHADHAALVENERRYRSLIENLPEAVAAWRKGSIIYANAAAIRLHGVGGPEEFIGRTTAEFLAPGTEDFVQREIFDKLESQETIGPFTMRVARLCRPTADMEIVATRYLQDGEWVTLFISRDISEQKRAQEALRESEERFRLLVDSMEDYAICMLDLSGHVTTWNRAAEAILGYAPDEIIGRHFECFFLPEERDSDEPAQLLQQVRQTGRYKQDGDRVRKNGEYFRAGAAITPVHNDAGESIGYAHMLRDLTERIRAEKSQRNLERQLLHSQKMQSVGTLAGGIAHDFNNILLAITGNVRMALEDCSPESTLREYLYEIEKATARASTLARRLLTFSRANELERRSVALAPVAQEAVTLLRAAIPAMVDIRLQCAANLPNALADPGQIEQALMNLGTNAAHAIGERSGGVIELILEAVVIDNTMAQALHDLHAGEYVRIAVIDNGCGMENAMLERIFDPFFTTKPPGQGTGLGLAIVHGIVKSHEGAIHIQSQPGTGTRFEVYLPATHAPVMNKRNDLKTQAAGIKQHVLYLDDEESLVVLMTRVLERLNYRVTGFCDPVEALKAFRNSPESYDLFISDLAMPGISGFDVVREVLNVRSDIPVVMTSGYLRPDEVDKAHALGVRALLLKPNSAYDLAKSLHDIFTEDAEKKRCL